MPGPVLCRVKRGDDFKFFWRQILFNLSFISFEVVSKIFFRYLEKSESEDNSPTPFITDKSQLLNERLDSYFFTRKKFNISSLRRKTATHGSLRWGPM